VVEDCNHLEHAWTLSTSEHLPRCSRLARQPCLVLINRYAHRHHRIACTISWLTCKPCAMREDLARPVKRTTRAGVWKDATTADNRRLRSGGKSEALLSGGVRRRLANQEMSQKATSTGRCRGRRRHRSPVRGIFRRVSSQPQGLLVLPSSDTAVSRVGELATARGQMIELSSYC
jgi:hypothetical protein